MALTTENQREFSPLLYDTLFGLILFFSLDSFLDIATVEHFIFYLFTNIILIHWWLLFRAATDIFRETRRSLLFIFFNFFYIILLEMMVLYARNFDYQSSALFLASIFAIDLSWVVLVKHFHEWKTKDPAELRAIHSELRNIVKSDLIVFVPFLILAAATPLLTPEVFVGSFIGFYIIYMVMTFRMKIIDIKFV